MLKFVHDFAEGNKDLKDLLGGKGANLAEMTNLGLMTWGFSREGVGQLIELAVRKGRAARPGLVIGVCGEHGGDPDSVHFFHQAGLDNVSCSPFRVPVARLEAGRAAVASGGSDTR